MKPEGLRTAAHALRYWEDRQRVVAHNLANADTKGFKAERVFARVFQDSLIEAESATDMRPGALTQTGAPLDVALEGEGFFVVDTPDGDRLTRGGALQIDASGRIVDASGYPVLGEDGPIVVPPGRIEIDARGTVRVEGQQVGRFRIETVPPGTRLLRDAAGRYIPDALRTPLAPSERRVRQGYLEESNVSAIESMVEMIQVQRSFAAVQNSVRVLDGVMDRIANQIGRIG
jgi:flagellar basal body rod protein FlgG